MVEQSGWEWISTGRLFRSSTDPAILKRLASGELIDDATTNEMLDAALRCAAGSTKVILDGYPRNAAQAHWLEKHLPDYGRSIEGVVVLTTDREELIQRLSARGRPEDAPEIIGRRLDIYDQRMTTVLQFYQQRQVPIHMVDGHGSASEVHDRVQTAVTAVSEACLPE